MQFGDQHRKLVRHYDIPGDAHFLTFSCYQRMPLLSKDRTRQWTVDAIRNAKDKLGFQLWAWMIMPEHMHVLLWPGNVKMKSILSALKQPVAMRAVAFLKRERSPFLQRLTVVNRNRMYHRFWQAGPGFDENLSDPEAVENIFCYIHRNPVDRELVTNATDWYWSSAADYAGLRSPHLIPLDRTIPPVHEAGG